MEAQTSINCTCHRVKWGTGCRWTNVIPVMWLSGFGQPCIHNGNLFFLHLLFILLLTIFLQPVEKTSLCLSFPFGKWVYHLLLGQLRIFFACLVKIWKMESILWSLKLIILFDVTYYHFASCPLSHSYVVSLEYLWSGISLWFPTFPMWKGDVL